LCNDNQKNKKKEMICSYPYTSVASPILEQTPFAQVNFFAVIVAGPKNYPICSATPQFMVQQCFFTKEDALRWDRQRREDGRGISMVLLSARTPHVFANDGTHWDDKSYQSEKVADFKRYRAEQLERDRIHMQKAYGKDEKADEKADEKVDAKVDEKETIVDPSQTNDISPTSSETLLSTTDEVEAAIVPSNRIPSLPPLLHTVPKESRFNDARWCLMQFPRSPTNEQVIILVGAATSKKKIMSLADNLVKHERCYSGLSLGALVAVPFMTWHKPQFAWERCRKKHRAPTTDKHQKVVQDFFSSEL
jgi:hypothetical protein